MYHGEWLAQAERDLQVASHLLDANFPEWAAYAAQQAAEKAIKAIRIVLGTDVEQIKIHKLEPLLGTVASLAPDPRLARASILDVHNEQARYPGLRGQPGQAPFRSYSPAAVTELLEIAEAVVTYAMRLVPDVEAFWKSRGSAVSSASDGEA